MKKTWIHPTTNSSIIKDKYNCLLCKFIILNKIKNSTNLSKFIILHFSTCIANDFVRILSLRYKDEYKVPHGMQKSTHMQSPFVKQSSSSVINIDKPQPMYYYTWVGPTQWQVVTSTTLVPNATPNTLDHDRSTIGWYDLHPKKILGQCNSIQWKVLESQDSLLLKFGGDHSH